MCSIIITILATKQVFVTDIMQNSLYKDEFELVFVLLRKNDVLF